MFLENIQSKKVMDVQSNKDIEGQNVLVWNKHGNVNQRWRIVYVDSKQDQTKGLNKDFGFFIDRPFYMVSRLSMKRGIAYRGGNDLAIRDIVDGSKDWKWTFDGKTKTIRSLRGDNSLAIMSSGGAKKISTEKTTSRWW